MLASAREDSSHEILTREITSFRKVGDLYRRSEETHRLRLIPTPDLQDQLQKPRFRGPYVPSLRPSPTPPKTYRLPGAQDPVARGRLSQLIVVPDAGQESPSPHVQQGRAKLSWTLVLERITAKGISQSVAVRPTPASVSPDLLSTNELERSPRCRVQSTRRIMSVT